ncbi:MAG: peptide chain release factor N(5)-glutamine methyltransferase [Flavisolibacter sp.]
MKMAEAEARMKQELLSIYGEGESAAIASMAMAAISGRERSQRLQQKDEALTAEQQKQFGEYLEKLKAQEPVQYVLNRCWFSDMVLYVDPSVLIPRPETEELVDWIIKDVKAAGMDVFSKRNFESDKTKTLKILDVGTGSGCIALALKKAMPLAEVWACDVSEEALTVARRNGAALDIRVDFQGVDFLNKAAQKGLPTVDIIVSNPPYVPLRDKESMHANVLDHEPHLALFVPNEDPLVFYKAIAEFGHHRLHENGCIYLEIHEGLAPEVTALFKNAGYKNVEVKKDMQGKERMVKVSG